MKKLWKLLAPRFSVRVAQSLEANKSRRYAQPAVAWFPIFAYSISCSTWNTALGFLKKRKNTTKPILPLRIAQANPERLPILSFASSALQSLSLCECCHLHLRLLTGSPVSHRMSRSEARWHHPSCKWRPNVSRNTSPLAKADLVDNTCYV